MIDILTSKQRRSSMPYFTLPFSLFRRHLSSQAHHNTSPASLNSANNDEVIEIGQSTSTSTQHTFSHPDEPLLTTPEDEERQRLRDAAAQSLGLDLNAVPENNYDPARRSPSSRPHSKSPAAAPCGFEITGSSPSSRHLLSSFPVNSPLPPVYSPSSLVTTTKLPAYPCSYSDLAPFIQISSSYLKFTTPTTTHSSLAFISLPKRSRSVKPYWKVYYVVLTAPREYGHRGLSPSGYSHPPQSPSSPYNFHALTTPTRFESTNSPPSTSSSFMPNHSHLHIFDSEHPTREEIEIDRLEINEDSVVYIADIELAGKKGLIKVTGRHVGASNAVNDEELGRTLWILKYPEIKNEAPRKRVVYPDESEIQQRWVKEIKTSVLSQRAERAGFLHASSQPPSARSSLLGNSSFTSSANNAWHLPISPNRQLSFFPQSRPSPPILPPPNPNPRYAEHIGAAPSSVSGNTQSFSTHRSSRLHSPPALKTAGLRGLFRTPSPSIISRDDASGVVKYRAISPTRNASRPSSRDGSVSVWSGVSHGIRGTTVKEEEEEEEKVTEPSQRKDIHPMAPDGPMEDYASFLNRLNTRFKESLKVKGKKDKKRPKSTGAMPDNNPMGVPGAPNADTFAQPVSNQDESTSFVPSRLQHFVRRPVSPVNEIMSVASIYSQNSMQDHIKEQDSFSTLARFKSHRHTKSASTGTISTSLLNGEDQNIAEWIISTTHGQGDGDMKNDGIPAPDKIVNHRIHRPNDRLSIGESLAISLSMDPSRDRRRSTTIGALAVPALKEDWASPHASGLVTVSGRTEPPNLTHPYGSEPYASSSMPGSSDTSRPISTTIQELSATVPASSRVSPSLSPGASPLPSARNSIDFKPNEPKTHQFAAGTVNGNPTISGAILKTTQEHENGDISKSEIKADDDDAYMYHGREYLTPRAVSSDLLRSFSQLKSTRSPFGHPNPPIYKRVSAPPAPLSATNSSNGLPPLRPPPSFAPPPPPSGQPSYTPDIINEGIDDKNMGTRDISNKIRSDGNVNINGPIEYRVTSRLPRLSLNPSPPPTQPLPPRPDEIITIVTADVQLIPPQSNLRRHSTSAGPRQKHYKTLITDDDVVKDDRSSFMSMYPMSVAAMIPRGNRDSKHGDFIAASTTTTVPAPQPPPQGPLPPTPGSKPVEKQGSPASPKGPRRPSLTRRSRIMTSPAPRTDRSDDIENKERDTTRPPFHREMTEVTRPRPFIPAPPKMRPPNPQKSSLERISTMATVISLPSAEHHLPPDLKSSPTMFLQMHDSPRTSVHLLDPMLDQNILPITEASLKNDFNEYHHLIGYSHHNHSETLVIPDAQENKPSLSPPRRRSGNSRDLRRTSGASAVLQGFQETPTPKGSRLELDMAGSHESNQILVPNDSEANEQDVRYESEPNVTEVNHVHGATMGMGRITPPPPSPLPITAQTPSRASSPSQLSSHSVPSYHHESSAESEETEDDFNY